MNGWLLFIPLVAAFIGWVTIRLFIILLFHPRQSHTFWGLKIQGIIPAFQKPAAEKAGKLLSTEFFSFSDIEKKITDEKNLEQLLPEVEVYIDRFLRVKLKEAFPVISNFIGDKTINQVKAGFMDELRTLFPELMKKYLGNLQKELDLEKLVAEKILSFSTDKIEQMMKKSLKKEIYLLEGGFALLGFLLGLIQLAIVHFIN